MRYIIVGVDVGTTSAAAALNLDGTIAGLKSGKDMGVDDIVAFIRKSGLPAIVATDVTPPPKAVSKIAISLGANIYAPSNSLSIEEKIQLTKTHNPANPHERDALAAALNAYRKMKNLLIKADVLDLTQPKKYEILKGGRIKDRLKKKVKPRKEKTVEKPRILSDEEKRIHLLEKQIKGLKKELADKERQVNNLKGKISLSERIVSVELARDKEVSRLRRACKMRGQKIKQLETESASFKQFRFLWNKLLGGEITALALFPQVTDGLTYMPNTIREAEKKYLKDAKLVFTDNKTNLKILDDLGMPHAPQDAVKRFHGCFYVDAKKITEAKKIKLDTLIRNYRINRKNKLKP